MENGAVDLCGVAGFELAQGARIIAEEIRASVARTLSEVGFVAYSDEEYATIRDATTG